MGTTVEHIQKPARDKASILVIENEEDIRALLFDILSSEGHRVVNATDGSEGLERFDREHFDIVLTDLAMPALSGWEVAHSIRERSPAVTIVLITGSCPRLEPAELRERGIDMVIGKPFRVSQIVDLARRAGKMEKSEDENS